MSVIQAIAAMIPVVLVVLAAVWVLWLIFRKGDMVTDPPKVVMYFVGVLFALVMAGCMMIYIFPLWIDQIWNYADASPSVQSLQERTTDLFDEALGQPVAAPTAAPVSPVPSPGSGVSSQSVPPPAPGQVQHVVQVGETLSSIGRRYNVSVKRLLEANPHLTNPDKVNAGDRLNIPKP